MTVAIPTRNRARLLREALGSALRQTETDIEIFVSDNASTDDTAEVVASFDDPRISYTQLGSNIGLHGNMSRCLRLGTAPYVSILQDDDLMLVDNLARKIEVLDRHPNVGLVHASFQVLATDGEVFQRSSNWAQRDADVIEPGPLFILRSFAGACRVNMSAAVMRRSAIQDENFDEADGGAPCFGLWMRIAARSDVAFLADSLTALRMHTDRYSVRLGINVTAPTGSRTFTHVALAQQVKERFLAHGGFPVHEARGLRRLSKDWARGELLRIVLDSSLPERSPLVTLHLLREAVSIEPSVLWSPKAGRVLLASVAGSRGRALVRRALGRMS